MSDFKIDATTGNMSVTMTEDEHTLVTTWLEGHKDDPNVQEAVRLSRDIEANLREMAEDAKRVERRGLIAKTMWEFWTPLRPWDKTRLPIERVSFLNCAERVLLVLEENDG